MSIDNLTPEEMDLVRGGSRRIVTADEIKQCEPGKCVSHLVGCGVVLIYACKICGKESD